MNNVRFKEEQIYAMDQQLLCDDTCRAIRTAIAENQAVGFVAGYYDEELTIAYVSEFFLHNLGYTCEEFMDFTNGSMKKLIGGENCSFIEDERFQKIHGLGEAQMLNREGVPINVCAYKLDTTDSQGTPLWVFSVHMDQMQENLKLVNKIIRSGFWSVDCNIEGRAEAVYFSHEFREMLGYSDILDFPNRIETWEKALHPNDRKRVTDIFAASLSDRTN